MHRGGRPSCPHRGMISEARLSHGEPLRRAHQAPFCGLLDIIASCAGGGTRRARGPGSTRPTVWAAQAGPVRDGAPGLRARGRPAGQYHPPQSTPRCVPLASEVRFNKRPSCSQGFSQTQENGARLLPGSPRPQARGAE